MSLRQAQQPVTKLAVTELAVTEFAVTEPVEVTGRGLTSVAVPVVTELVEVTTAGCKQTNREAPTEKNENGNFGTLPKIALLFFLPWQCIIVCFLFFVWAAVIFQMSPWRVIH